MNENRPVIGLYLRHPYVPLFTDKLIMWLGSHLARQGMIVRVISEPKETDCDLIISNAKCDDSTVACIVVRDVLDLVGRLRRIVAALIAKTRYYHPRCRQSKRPLVQNMVDGLRKIPSLAKGERAYQPAQADGPFRGKVVFRVNIDYDQQGLQVLEGILADYDFPLTLAIAGSEIAGREEELVKLIERWPKIDISSHSYAHYIYMPNLSKEEQFAEIKRNHDYLKKHFGREVKGFVSPYLLYDQDTFAGLSALGYRWFIRSYLLSPLKLPGYDLVDLGTNIFKYHLKSWRNSCPGLLADTTLVLQLHLHDLPLLQDEIRAFLQFTQENNIELISCSQYYQSYISAERKVQAVGV